LAGKKTYILDTNVLIHDPESMHSFKGHEVVIPFEALEELDKLKKRFDQIGHNARQVIRNLGEFIDTGRIDGNNGGRETGEISIGSPVWLNELPADRKAVSSSTDNRIDNKIISLAWLYKQKHNGNTVFVSKDINARIKAKILGIQTEDYENDKVDISTIYSGHTSLVVSKNVIDELHAKGDIAAGSLNGGQPFFENQCILLTAPDGSSSLGISKHGKIRKISLSNSSFWGIKARNKEQQFAMQLLVDNSVHAVTLIGQAGTGKTILALAVGLHKTLEEGMYQRIFITKPVVPVGRQDIGFLPGDKEEKMLPWVQSVFDNFAPLSMNSQKMTLDYMRAAHLLEIESIAHIRGRSIARSWIMVDEAQNLTPHEIKTILSRVGEGSKIVLTGDIYQIDSPYLDGGSNGLSYLVNRFKGQPLYGHITLNRTIRSPLASMAAELL